MQHFTKNNALSQYTIHKYPLINKHFLTLPKGAQILKLGMQANRVMLWAAVPLTSTKEERWLPHLIGTGWTLDLNLKFYRDTLQDEQGFVWHVFLEPEFDTYDT